MKTSLLAAALIATLALVACGQTPAEPAADPSSPAVKAQGGDNVFRRLAILTPDANQEVKPYTDVKLRTVFVSDITASLMCEKVVWRTNFAADGTRWGCASTFRFNSEGPRTVTATYEPNANNPAYTAQIPIVVVNHAPLADMFVPAFNQSVDVNESFSLLGLVGDRDNDALVYEWRLIVNPNLPSEKTISIPGTAGVITGALKPYAPFTPTRALPVYQVRLRDFGAPCDGVVRRFDVVLYVSDGFLSPGSKEAMARRAVYSKPCVP
jgi:hypothetical protein